MSNISNNSNQIDFTFNAKYDEQENSLVSSESGDGNLELSFILDDKSKVNQILLNQTPLKFTEYTDTNSARESFDEIIEQYEKEHGILFGETFYKKSDEEKKHIIAANTEFFDYKEAIRNIYNVGSIYSGKDTWIVVPGLITTMEMTGFIDGKPSYKGIIRQDVIMKGSFYYAFSYTGSDFTYMEGDSITAYATIYSDASINHYDSQGNFINTSQSIEIEIKMHDRGTVFEDYQLNNFEKEFYLNKTYRNEDTIYFSFDKIGEHPIEIVSIRKYGDGHLQVSYKFTEIKYINSGNFGDIRKTQEYLYLYPSGRLELGNSDFYQESDYYREDLIAG